LSIGQLAHRTGGRHLRFLLGGLLAAFFAAGHAQALVINVTYPIQAMCPRPR